MFTYASFLSLRGLWLGPVLIDRYGFSLVQTGNVALRVHGDAVRGRACDLPHAHDGSGMAVFTMAMFLGVALMQWLTGLAASAAAGLGVETYTAVFGAIALFLLLGTALFRFLPGPRAVSAEAAQSTP